MWTISLESKAEAPAEPTGTPPPAQGPWHLPVPNGATSYTVGRKEQDVNVANDKSMSRKHAEFAASATQLTLRDLGSKYGVYLGADRLGAEPHVLADGAQVKLGSTFFSVRRTPLVVCMSGVSGAQKATLRTACDALGATVAKDWQDDVRAPTLAHASALESATYLTLSPRPLVLAASRHARR